MQRRTTAEPPPPGDHPGSADPDPTAAGPDVAEDASPAIGGTPPLDGLSVAGITRGRVLWIVVALVSVWVVIVFARQVGEAAAAAGRVERATQQNALIAADVHALEQEAQLIQRQAFIDQQARAYGLGDTQERPFRLAPGAPPLAANAPGSAAARLGADGRHETPLESWLSLLFGPPATD
jgi:cell division protein FtsB